MSRNRINGRSCQWNRSRNKCSNLLEKVKSYSNSRLNPKLGKVTNLVMEDGNTATTNKLKAETFASSLGRIHQINYDQTMTCIPRQKP